MRRRKAPKREIEPDLVYRDKVVAKFINIIMQRGKKTIAQKIVYGAFDIIREKMKKDPLEVFYKAIENVRPRLEVRPRRIGGATYQIPIEVPKDRGIGIALRWLRDAARSRKGKPMKEKLAEELILAFKNQGTAVKKRDDTHRMAEANKAFAHFRW